MRNFLFVCTGNTCRSPMAEAVLRHLAGDKINVQSAGIYAGHGYPANEKAVHVLQQKGVVVSHKSQPLTDSLLEWADIVLTMTVEHKQAINQRYPQFIEKVYTLKEYVLLIEGKDEIWDEIKRLYAEIETKRLQFLADQSVKQEEDFWKDIEMDYQKLQELEKQLPSLDIVDPFGGTLAMYQQTLDQLYMLLHKVNEKIDNSST